MHTAERGNILLILEAINHLLVYFLHLGHQISQIFGQTVVYFHEICKYLYIPIEQPICQQYQYCKSTLAPMPWEGLQFGLNSNYETYSCFQILTTIFSIHYKNVCIIIQEISCFAKRLARYNLTNWLGNH